jgi:hypothetical protein
MYDVKPWYQSSGIWGGLIAVIAPVAGFFGYTLTADDAKALADGVTQLIVAGSGVASIVGGIIAIVGRVRASKKIAA